MFDSNKDDLIELVGESSYEIEQNEERSEGVISSCIASGALRLRYLSTIEDFWRTRVDLLPLLAGGALELPLSPAAAAATITPSSAADDDGVHWGLCIFSMAKWP